MFNLHPVVSKRRKAVFLRELVSEVDVDDSRNELKFNVVLVKVHVAF